MKKKKERSVKKTLLIILLANLIALASCYVIKVYALDEFIDDYENENHIQAKYNVVRNIIYNCMELEYDSGFISYENFTTWIENDALNKLSQTDERTIWTNLNRQDDQIYLYKDLGADGIIHNWIHQFELNLSKIDISATAYFRIDLIAYTNLTQDFKYFLDNDISSINIIVRSNNVANQYWISHVEIEGATDYYEYIDALIKDDVYEFLTNIEYYFTIRKLGTNIDIKVYSDSARTNKVANLTKTLHGNDYYRYIMCPASLGYPTGNYKTSGYIEKLNLEAMGYRLSGYFYTKEVLSSLNNNTITLLTNCSLNTGTITVEFSPNNNTWINHNNITGSSDNLIIGFESIDLRDVNINTLYMRINYTRGDYDKTPRLRQIRVITSDLAPKGGGLDILIFSFILFPCALLILGIALRRKRK